MRKRNIDVPPAARSFLDVICNYGCQNLNQALSRTPYYMSDLETARDFLLENKFIKPVKRHVFKSPELIPYEARI